MHLSNVWVFLTQHLTQTYLVSKFTWLSNLNIPRLFDVCNATHCRLTSDHRHIFIFFPLLLLLFFHLLFFPQTFQVVIADHFSFFFFFNKESSVQEYSLFLMVVPSLVMLLDTKLSSVVSKNTSLGFTRSPWRDF